jgi:hypothetical protein
MTAGLLTLPAPCHTFKSHCPSRRWQKSIADKLKPIEVDPNDKSFKAYLTRARNVAFQGLNHDIQEEIADDVDLTAVSDQ